MQATCNVGFPVDNLFVEEPFRALSAYLRVVVTEVIRQGAAVVLATAQL